MPHSPLMKPIVPVPPLTGEQVRFWLQILEDHAAFLRAGLIGEHTASADQAQSFYQELRALRRRAEQLRKPTEVVEQALPVLVNFYRFQRQLLTMMITCRTMNHLYPLQLDHLLRENDYVIRLFGKIQYDTPVATKAQENLFWVRIMGDHSQFIGDLVDPSERNVVDTARSFAREFADLYLQGRDFVSMLDRRHQDAPVFLRYLEDTRRATLRLRDFKKLAEDLIRDCRLLGILPAELANHLRREAEQDLAVLAMLLKNSCTPKTMAEPDLFSPDLTPEDGAALADDDPCETSSPDSDPPDCETLPAKWTYPHYKPSSQLWEEDREEDRQEDQREELPVLPLAPQLESDDTEGQEGQTGEKLPLWSMPDPVSDKAAANLVSSTEGVKASAGKTAAKTKWSDHWPRPLGKKLK